MKNTLIPITSTTGSNWLAVLFVLFFIISGCSIDGIENKGSDDITEEDLEAASQILGESLSDENSGVMGSLNDALTTVSSNGFVRNSAAKSATGDDDNSGRGRERNFSYSYNAETGTHILIFQRVVTNSNFSKTVDDTLKYIFTDNSGTFIAEPRAQRERVETIDFKGSRQGTIESPNRNSFFARRDTLIIDGVSKSSAILNIDGVHNGEGTLNITNEQGNKVDRTYRTEINFLNIQIEKSVMESNQSLEQGVTGTLTYEMVIEKTNNGASSEKTIRGTIEFNGDGTALLRFERFKKLFQINLHDGHIRDQDDEFEGRVARVSLEHHTFELANGRIIRLTGDTKIDAEGDLRSLEGVSSMLQHTPHVRAEGEGFIDGDVFVATEVKFEADDDSDDDRDDDNGDDAEDFEGSVASINLVVNTFTLENGTVILINHDTEFKDDDGFQSLEAVAEVLNQGKSIEADGKGTVIVEDAGIDILASEVEFKEDSSGSDDD